MPEPLSPEAVRHVARLARLALADDDVERYRTELSSVLEHIETMSALAVEGVEPMAHPMPIVNRLAEDVPAAPLPLDALLANAPATLDRYLAVPKVLADEGGG